MSNPITNVRINRRLSLEQLLARPLFFFDLDSILKDAGPTMLRNPNRLEIVCEHCVRAVTHTDEVLFEGKGFYLFVTSCDEPNATNLANQIAASLLRCFFGNAEPPPNALRSLFRRPSREQIAGLSETTVAPGEPAAVDAEESTACAATARPPAKEATDPVVDLAAHGIHNGEGFRFGFVPVHDLRTGRLSTLSCETVRTVDMQIVDHRDSFESIGSRDLPRVDQAMLLQSLAFGKRLQEAGVVAAVSTSVSFETLAWSKGRQFYQNALRATASATNSLLIVTIDMVPPGTPAMRIVDLVACIRPYAKRVFVHLPDGGYSLLQESALGAAGYVLSLRPGTSREEVSAHSIRFAKLCNIQNALSCVTQIPDLTTAERIRAAGVRFGAGDFAGSSFYFEDSPREALKLLQQERRDLGCRKPSA